MLALLFQAAANDSTITARGRTYHYERTGRGYRLSRPHASGRTEVQVTGSPDCMTGSGDGLAGMEFAVRGGRLVVVK